MIDSKLFFVISCPALAHVPGATATGAIQIEKLINLAQMQNC